MQPDLVRVRVRVRVGVGVRGESRGRGGRHAALTGPHGDGWP